MGLLVVGSVAYDAIETPFAKTEKALGGSAMFFSAAAGYFAPVHLVGVVGNDFDFDELAFLRKNNIDFEGLTIENGETFRWAGRYLNNMIDRETIYTHLGVFESFNPLLPEKYKENEFIFLANIHPSLQYSVLQQIHRPTFIAMDTMNFWITGALEDLKKTLQHVDALIINDSEVRLLSQEHNLFTGARKIQSMGPQVLIIKKGEHGAILIQGDSYFACPALPIENLFDPTGAGDTFAGGFMGYLAECGSVNETNLRRAVAMGAVMASFCVERFSAERLKNLTIEEIRQRAAQLLRMIQVEGDDHWLHL
ncbi:MAG: sugar kinase [Calditrichaeota bacterium]|nr:MAG: sugar kinase [Calditrichota bacterium]RPI03831.1 MAG: sugar kinase [Calditrichota bacterium]